LLKQERGEEDNQECQREAPSAVKIHLAGESAHNGKLAEL
jgi:hypothetical protein